MSNSIAIFKPDTLTFKGDAYLGNLLQLSESQPQVIQGSLGEYLQNVRQRAANMVVKQNFPTTRQEEWRFTDLSDLQEQEFVLANQLENIDSSILEGFALPEASRARIVFVNGFYTPELSDVSALGEGVHVGNLRSLPPSLAGKVGQYLAHTESEAEVFTNLNTAGIADAAIIWVNPHVEMTAPIHFLHLSVREDAASFAQPRILVVAQPNSSLELIEYYGALAVGCSDAARQQYYFTNAVTEIFLQENARVNHTRIQRESGDGFHIGKTAIAQGPNSRYTLNEVSLGGRLYRHNLHVQQQGGQTETYLNGLSMLQGKQSGDTYSQVSLNHPHGTVNQLHKYILDDSAHGVFNGKIQVPQPAQLTNATQLNRNLLLSSKARINTKPELQITADNVKCSHGATVSQLEADEIFYLRSRGLNDYDARHLLIDAFAAEILDKIPYRSLHQRLSQCVACRTLD